MEMLCTDIETGAQFRADPIRDIAYFLPQLVLDVEARLAEEFLPHSDKERLASAGLDASRLQQTFVCFARIFECTLDSNLKSPLAAAEAACFFAEPQVCQDIVLATFAKSCIGACWAGLRSSLFAGECPARISVIKNRVAVLTAGWPVAAPTIVEGGSDGNSQEH
jgi:hypothetical protein